jgi:hypothetical protein
VSRQWWRKTLAAYLLIVAVVAGLPPHLPWWRVVMVSVLVYAAVKMLP